MNYLFTLFVLVMANSFEISVSQSKCSCSDITFEDDCQQLKSICNWNETACSMWDCSEIDSQDTCTTANLCAWTDNSCKTFTKCSDYSTQDAPCDTQGTGCGTSDDQNEETQAYACIDKISPTTTIGKCSTYRNNETCIETGIGCFWTGRVCRILDCSDYTTNETCTRVYSDNYQVIKICEWTESESCSQASSLEILNQENCISLTNRRATWNSDEGLCKFCSSSFSLLIASILSVVCI